MYKVKWNYNDVSLFSIEPVKKTNVPSGLYIYDDEEELYQNLKNLSIYMYRQTHYVVR